MGETILSILLVVGILVVCAVATNWFTNKMYNRCRACGCLNARRRDHCRECGEAIAGPSEVDR